MLECMSSRLKLFEADFPVKLCYEFRAKNTIGIPEKCQKYFFFSPGYVDIGKRITFYY